MQCTRNMVRCSGRMDTHISPLFRLLLPVRYDWHRRSSDHVAVDVQFCLFAFNPSKVFKGLHVEGPYPKGENRQIDMRPRYLILLSGSDPKQRATYQPTSLSA